MVSDHEVADSPTLPAAFELVGDLVDRPEECVRCRCRILRREPGHAFAKLADRRIGVIGDLNHLDQGAQLDVVEPVLCSVADLVELLSEVLCSPAHGVAMPVFEVRPRPCSPMMSA